MKLPPRCGYDLFQGGRMSFHIKLSDLTDMNKRDMDSALGDLVRAAKAPRNGQRPILESRIRALEFRYEMSSAVMQEKWGNGEIEETEDIAHWLHLIAARDNQEG